MIHELKIAPMYFDSVISGKKTFEVRKDDRDYQENDVLILKEYDNNAYTGREYAVIVTYILRGEYCKDGYCIMSIKRDNYRNTLRVIRNLGYNTEVYESDERNRIFFYQDSNEKRIIYVASYEKDMSVNFNVRYGHLIKDSTYGEDSLWCGFYNVSGDSSTEGVIKEIDIVNYEIDQEYDYGDTRVYFDNIEEIIKLYTEKHNYRKIE